MCQVWLKLVLWFLRRFLNLVNVYLDFGNYPSLENRMPIHLTKPESPSPKDAFSGADPGILVRGGVDFFFSKTWGLGVALGLQWLLNYSDFWSKI